MPFYDYSCPACGVFEHRGRVQDDETECACGKRATRLAVYEIGVSGFSRAPVNQREIRLGQYTEAAQEVEHQHSRRTNLDGSLGPTPPLWQMAKAKAKKLESMGVKDSLDMR